METFSYRSLLHVTFWIAASGAGLGLLTAVGWFLQALMAGGARPVPAGGVDSGRDRVDDAVLGLRQVLRLCSWLLVLACLLALVSNFSAQLARSIEVQHWPAQSLYEVLPLVSTAGFLVVLVLYFVLGLPRVRGVARGFGDLFVALVLALLAGVLFYALRLDPTGRALPPALQSAWFPTHITAYAFGYSSLLIATMGTWLHFCFKFWRGVLQPRRYPLTRGFFVLMAVATVAPVPFGWMGLAGGPGVLLLCGLLSALSLALPRQLAWFDSWEEGADRFTFLIFLVGFPLLTAGLIQGSLWAQEAWALYWGWDSKEVSAFISWIFYLVYLHLRLVAGWRGERSMWILLFGGLSIYITFMLFGHLPASRSSLHRYTDMDTIPAEGMMSSG